MNCLQGPAIISMKSIINKIIPAGELGKYNKLYIRGVHVSRMGTYTVTINAVQDGFPPYVSRSMALLIFLIYFTETFENNINAKF